MVLPAPQQQVSYAPVPALHPRPPVRPCAHKRPARLRALASGLAVAALAAAGPARSAPADLPDLLTEPKWEVGLFLGVARLPLYQGSADDRVYLLPIPFLIYRGDVVQTDRDGLRGIFLRTTRLETTVSLSVHPPVGNEDGPREGMPELLPLLEVGPALKWWPVGRHDDWSFHLQLAGRVAASVDVEDSLATRYEGWRSELSATYSRYLADPRWRCGTSLSVGAGSSDYHRYFYDVPAAYATADRPAYDAAAGYSGAGWSVFLSRKLSRRLTTGAFARWDQLAGAVYEDSPLIEQQNSVIAGLAVIWRFTEPDARVTRQADRDAR